MAHKVDLEIAGVVENMAGFVTPGGERFPIFGEGGGQELADELDVPLLGKVPLTMPLREQADAGEPLVFTDPDDPAAQAIRQAARGLIAMFPAELPMLQVGRRPGRAPSPSRRRAGRRQPADGRLTTAAWPRRAPPSRVRAVQVPAQRVVDAPDEVVARHPGPRSSIAVSRSRSMAGSATLSAVMSLAMMTTTSAMATSASSVARSQAGGGGGCGGRPAWPRAYLDPASGLPEG